MTPLQFIVSMLSLALLLMLVSPAAHPQGSPPAGKNIGTQGADSAKMAVELGLLREIEKPLSKSSKRLDVIKAAVKQAQDLMQAKKFPEALATLADLDSVPDRTAEQNYLIERTRVAIASAAGDQPLLVTSLEAVLATGQAPPKERMEFIDLLARRYFNQNNFAKAITWSTRHFDEGGKDISMRRLQILSYYLSQDYARTRQEVAADIEAQEAAGRKPTEEQLRLLVSSAQKLGDTAAQASAMEKYSAHYPNRK